MKFLTLILLLSIPSVESVSATADTDIAGTYKSLLEAEEKGNLGMVMRYRSELVMVCKGKELLTLLPGDENSLLRIGCQRVIGMDHEQNRRLDDAVRILSPIVQEHIESDGPARKIALKALLPLARSYGEKGQIDQAITVLEKGLPYLESGSVDIREAWLLSGDLKAAKGEVLPAKRDWSRLTDDLNKFGDDARARRNSAVRLALLGKKAPSLGDASWFGGKKKSLKSMQGQVVLLDFWATWCGPCRMLMPGLDKIQQRLAPKGLQILGVTKPYAQGWLPERDNPKRGQTVRGMTRDAFLQHLLEFRRRFGVDYPFVVTGKQGFDAYKVGGIPMVVLINKKGEIAWVRVGSGGEGLLEATLERLLLHE